MAGENGEHPSSYVTQEQLQQLVQGFNDQLNENMVAAQKNMVVFAECPNNDPQQTCLCWPIYDVRGLPCDAHDKPFAMCILAKEPESGSDGL